VNIVREWSPHPKPAHPSDDFDEGDSLALLSGMIAHEVKSPLAGLLQGVEFVRSSVLDNDLLLDALQRIEETALRVIRVAGRLLELAARPEPKREKADLSRAIDRSLSMLDDQIRRKHLTVRKRFATDVPPARVDVTQMEEVFANILMNAAEAVPAHGILEVSLQAEKGEGGSTWVRVTLSDNGPGIPEEDMARIFAPFFTSKKATGGVGLGLTISKKIVEKHGGTILIEGRAGGGTSVIVRLPVA
jgi:two-component system NtrC family sensor kinase